MIKKLFALLLSLVTSLTLFACGGVNKPEKEKPNLSSDSVSDGKSDPGNRWNDGSLDDCINWFETNIKEKGLFSFTLNEKNFNDTVSEWEETTDRSETESTIEYKIRYKHVSGILLEVSASVDKKFASVEWVMNFTNMGSSDSEIISKIEPIDCLYETSADTVFTANGSSCAAIDFAPVEQKLTNSRFITKSEGGRSSSGGFPYFDICDGSSGVVGGIGWTGNWQAVFEKNDTGIHITAGMQRTKISLRPGESIRSPSILLIFFKGDRDDGHNKFRQLILSSYTPSDKNGDTLTKLPFFINTWGGLGEEDLIREVRTLNRIDIGQDALWIDAGWYCSKKSSGSGDTLWSSEIGNWSVSKALYPNGFNPVKSELDKSGTELLVWFEPERAASDTLLVKEHPNYYLKSGSTYLLNLADDEVCDFMTANLTKTIKDNGISWYRQDFNISPAPFWSDADKTEGENRNGITEIKYITNLYRMLDGLVENCPGLLIDNCASGGRRLDFEMMKRSVPLWRTDYNIKSTSTTDEIRSINYNLSYWLPLSEGGCSSEGRVNDYMWRSMLSGGLVLGMASVETGLYKGALEEYLSCTKYMRGDYYILEQTLGQGLYTEYAAYEYYLNEEKDGIVVIFRPKDCTTSKTVVRLKGLEPDRIYTVDVTDTGEKLTASGRELMELGLTVKIKRAFSSLLIRFS